MSDMIGSDSEVQDLKPLDSCPVTKPTHRYDSAKK